MVKLFQPGSERKILTKETWFSLLREVKVLEIAVGASFCPDKACFCPHQASLVGISIRDLIADRNSSVRNSGVGDGDEN